MKRSILFLSLSASLGCIKEPSYVGRPCSPDKPCPGPLICVPDPAVASGSSCQTSAPPADLGPADLGPMDLGIDDLGPPDLGQNDLGLEDLGPPDLGPTDLGPPDLGPPRVLNAAVAQSDHDAMQDPGGPMLLQWRWISMYSDDHWGALRFDLSALPKGATIVEAYVQLYVDSLMEDSPRVQLWAEASDSPAPLIANANNISDRPRTVAMVPWIDQNIGDGWQRTPSLNALLEEVIQRPGWSGEVLFIFDSLDVVGMDYFEFRQWDDMSGAFSPQLVVVYR